MRSRSAGSTYSSLLRCRHSAGPPIKRRETPSKVWPIPCGIIWKAIRNNYSPAGSPPSCTCAASSDAGRSHVGKGPASDRDCDGVVRPDPDPYPIWWRGVTSPPPAQWAYVFDDLTGEHTAEEWALAAAIFIAQTRRKTGQGPTFAELFTHLLPETSGLPAAFPPGLEFIDRRRALSGFRGHVAIEWRRRAMINWDKDVERSLRVGRSFRQRSRRRQELRRAATITDTRGPGGVAAYSRHPARKDGERDDALRS